MTTVERVRELIDRRKTADAEKLVHEALAETPDDKDLLLERGRLYCFSQREFLGLSDYETLAGHPDRHKLGTLLADYFFCRKQMLAKHGVCDPATDAAIAKIEEAPGKVGAKLSACLIVKNEERNLDRCLKSLKDVVDEIVVVDTGSTDRTVEIAKQYGAMIGHFEWIDDFAAARNYSLDLATGDWALWIDADEELTADSIPTIREAIMRPQFGGYYIQIVNLMDAENDRNQYVHMPVRLFRRIPEIRFEGRIHEQVLQGFDRHRLLPATLQTAKLLHYGYQAASMDEKNKIERTISMLETEVADFPDDPFHWFNLANVYSLAQRAADCERAASESAKRLTDYVPYAPVVFQLWSGALVAQGRALEAIRVADQARERGFFEIVNQFEYAHALMKAGKPEQALVEIEKVASMEWPPELPGDTGIQSYKGDALRAQILNELKRSEEALPLCERALEADHNFTAAWFAKGQALSNLGRCADAAMAYERASTGPGLRDCRILAAQEWRKAGEKGHAYHLLEAAWREESDRADLAAAWLQIAGEAGDPSLMTTAYETCIAHGFVDSAALVNYGRALAESGDARAAAERYGQAIQVDPNNANAYFNLGDLLYRLEMYADAAGVFEQGLRLQPDHADAWFVLGNCFAQLGHAEGARKAYEVALGCDASHQGARHNLQMVA